MEKRYYHFSNKTLRDGKPIPEIGEWLTVQGEIVPCENGLHASEHPFDALQYAPGSLLHLVELDGEIKPYGSPVDKFAARKRKIIATIDAEDLLWEFTRKCALNVIHLRDAPDVVKQYLTTGDELLRATPWDAAWAAAWDSARATSWDAALDAAWAAAWDAARATSWDAARDASWDAALAAAWDAERQMFLKMVDAAFAKVLEDAAK